MSIGFAINNLRSRLLNAGYHPYEAEDICREASIDLNRGMIDIAASYMQEAEQYGQQMGADEFVDDLYVMTNGDTLTIATKSGKVNYSRPEEQVLPKLLRGGKRAKDGSTYRRIPMQDKSSKSRDMFQAMQVRQEDVERIKKKVNESIGVSTTSAPVGQTIRQFMSEYQAVKGQNASKVEANKVSSPDFFKTASSKQDPAESWVRPAKELNMANFLAELNYRLDVEIHSYIDNMIKEFGA